MSDRLLVARGLRVAFDTARGDLYAVDGVDLEVRAGEVLGLVGESGSGKSVTLRALTRLLPPNARLAGDVTWRGEDVATMPPGRLRQIRGAEIAMVFQEPTTALDPVLTIGLQIDEALVAHTDLSRRARRHRAVELLDLVGIPSPAARLANYPHEFSGGMRQRAMIAIAIAGAPKLLLADEPTTALDVTIQDQILKLLLGLVDDLGMAMVLVTHDLGVIAETCDRVAVMYAGRIVETGPVAAIFERPRHAYTLALLRSAPDGGAVRQPLQPIPGQPPRLDAPIPGCPFLPRCGYASPPCEVRPPLVAIEPDHAAACVAADRLPPPGTAGMSGGEAPLLSVEHVSKAFALHRTFVETVRRAPPRLLRAVDDVSFDVRRGETLGIVGESGCGKSTLARCLVRLHEPDGGAVRFEGRDVLALAGAARRRYNRRVQMIFQDPYHSLNPRLSVRDCLTEALAVHDVVPPADIPARVARLLDQVHLSRDAAERYPHEFSGGQRQRIGIARALAVEPQIIIADEPVSALDVSVQAQIVNLLLELQANLGVTLLFITHDLRLVRLIAHRTVVMYLGRIVEIGPTVDLFAAPRHPYSAALLKAVPRLVPGRRGKTAAVRGELPSPLSPPAGCTFHPRCPMAREICRRLEPALDMRGGAWPAACHFAGA